MVLEQLTSTWKKGSQTDITPFTKLNSRWIIGLNVTCKNIKLLEENIGKNIDDLEDGDDFLDTTPKALSMEEIIDKLDFVKIENVYSKKDTINRTES